MGYNNSPDQFLRQYAKDRSSYYQGGTDIPTFGIGQSAEGGSGTGIEPYYQETTVATEPTWGGNPQQEVPREALEKLSKPGSPPPPGFFDELRRKFGTPGVKQAASFDLAPYIDSPAVDEWLRQRRELYGPVPVSPNVLEDARRAGQRIRAMQSKLKGV
jgi:hypothetical protein